MTAQRRIILEELKKVRSHPTADELYRMVRKRLPKVSLGTIYRNLETLAESGLIQRMEIPGTTMRFDGEASDHLHLRCTSCGAVRDIELGDGLALPSVPRDVDGCRITGYRLDLTGLCPECLKKAHATGA